MEQEPTPRSVPSAEPDFGASESHIEQALGYLDTAQNALRSVEQLTAGPLHMEFYAESGLSSTEIVLLANYTKEHVISARPGPDSTAKPATLGGVMPKLRQIVGSYQRIDIVSLTNPLTPLTLMAVRAVIFNQLTVGTASKQELDQLLQQADAATLREPSLQDYNVVAGLGIARLAQFLEGMNIKVGPLRGKEPLEQALHLARSYYKTGRSEAAPQATLTHAICGDRQPTIEMAEAIGTALVGIPISEAVLARTSANNNGYPPLYAQIISSALKGAATHVRLAVHHQPTVDTISPDGQISSQALGHEKKLHSASLLIEKRIDRLLADINALAIGAIVDPINEALASLEFPVVEQVLASELARRQAASRAAGRVAANETIQAPTKTPEQLQESLAKLRDTYLMKIPDAKARSTRDGLGRHLASGGAKAIQRWEGTQPDRDMLHSVLGLLYQLDKPLQSQDNNATDIFAGLFEAVEQEAALMAQPGEVPTNLTLQGPAEWLRANAASLRSSPIRTLRRIGDGLAAYELARAISGDSGSRPRRSISVNTLREVEHARSLTWQLVTTSFSPSEPLLGALTNDIGILMEQRDGKIIRPDDERLLLLDSWDEHFRRAGYPTQVFRILPSSSRQPQPYYSLVVEIQSEKIRGKKMIITEDPQAPGAIYMFEAVNPDIIPWQAVTRLPGQAIRELGGIRINTRP